MHLRPQYMYSDYGSALASSPGSLAGISGGGARKKGAWYIVCACANYLACMRYPRKHIGGIRHTKISKNVAS